MKLVIDIPEVFYEYCKAEEGAIEVHLAIKNGTPLPEGAEILTKEAYSDLCLRASVAQSALDRAKVLLKATQDILQKQKDSPIVLDVLCETAVWDDCECDGYCLSDDIADWLEENEDGTD